jgi:hypothetical protein
LSILERADELSMLHICQDRRHDRERVTRSSRVIGARCFIAIRPNLKHIDKFETMTTMVTGVIEHDD